ncbi:hypothetical protein [Candidatus Nitronereus thalassa]|uniref:Uncharacterized protein n=1 Tax=Candidatus Nitronereus thalassa TaxID=3020898 RepID=A0ABU3K9Z1_9BACT|nr:hypothetical protein [Candidatus Nitronereus thalassa]MDT7043250.1 hypothetical protein [Candidatus Nitronereus thalassa]
MSDNTTAEEGGPSSAAYSRQERPYFFLFGAAFFLAVFFLAGAFFLAAFFLAGAFFFAAFLAGAFFFLVGNSLTSFQISSDTVWFLCSLIKQ